jgi:hypothetical protein
MNAMDAMGTHGEDSGGAPASRQHPDELTLLLIADGEVAEGAELAHVAGCEVCTSRIAAFRAEAEALRGVLALDATELTFLAAAALPGQLAARAEAARRAAQREQRLGFLGLLGAAALGYGGWLLAVPLLAQLIELGRRAGSAAWLAGMAASAAWWLMDTLASAVEAASTVPGFGAPLLTLSIMAGLTWLALLVSAGRQEERLAEQQPA